jgi:hypothetical protein
VSSANRFEIITVNGGFNGDGGPWNKNQAARKRNQSAPNRGTTLPLKAMKKQLLCPEGRWNPF